MSLSEDVKRKIDQALIEKENGNNAVRAGDATKALRKYYAAILLLKGLSGQGLHTYSGPSRSSLSSQPRITEVPSNDARSDGGEADDAESDDGHQAEEESESEEEEEEVEENAQHYSGDGVKKLICQCYVNMAICHAKNNAWDKCKRNAEEALKQDETNEKALFKQAQATVRLGQVSAGRKLLQELLKTSKDPAIGNELRIIDQAEKASSEKGKAGMRGFINKANPVVPKIQEIKQEVTSKEAAPPVVEQSNGVVQQKNGIETPPTTPEKANNAAAAITAALGENSAPISEKAANGQIELPPTPPQVTAQ